MPPWLIPYLPLVSDHSRNYYTEGSVMRCFIVEQRGGDTVFRLTGAGRRQLEYLLHQHSDITPLDMLGALVAGTDWTVHRGNEIGHADCVAVVDPDGRIYLTDNDDSLLSRRGFVYLSSCVHSR